MRAIGSPMVINKEGVIGSDNTVSKTFICVKHI